MAAAISADRIERLKYLRKVIDDVISTSVSDVEDCELFIPLENGRKIECDSSSSIPYIKSASVALNKALNSVYENYTASLLDTLKTSLLEETRYYAEQSRSRIVRSLKRLDLIATDLNF